MIKVIPPPLDNFEGLPDINEMDHGDFWLAPFKYIWAEFSRFEAPLDINKEPPTVASNRLFFKTVTCFDCYISRFSC
jgi:hypothetical protein